MDTARPLMTITLAEVMEDLEAGRSRPPSPPGSRYTLRPVSRPTLGGGRFRWTWLAATALGRLHPRLARRPLAALWFTPWVHPSARAPVELPAGSSPWSLPAEGSTLHGYTGGSGPVVVLVHGWAGRALDWRHLAADLVASGHRVVVPDLPAHGLTEGRRTDLDALGRALARVLDHERATAVVTHSMGFPVTLLALEEGASEPDVLVAVAPGRTAARAVDGFAARTGLPATLVAELRRVLEARFGRGVWQRFDADRSVTELRATGVVIHDADDDEVPVVDAMAIAARWPASRFVATHDLGHRRILRDPAVRDAIVAAVSEGREDRDPQPAVGATAVAS